MIGYYDIDRDRPQRDFSPDEQERPTPHLKAKYDEEWALMGGTCDADDDRR